MNTREAFKQLVLNKDLSEKAGIKDATRRGYVNYLKDGRTISLDKMNELLELAGYKKVISEVWAEQGADLAGADPELFKSTVRFLIDVPPNYWDDYKGWHELHSHMIPEDMEFIEKIRWFDEYYKRLKHQTETKSNLKNNR